MAAIDFPSSPTTNQIYSTTDRSWRWNGTNWEAFKPALSQAILSGGVIAGGSASSAAATISISEVSKPISKFVGDDNGISVTPFYGLNRVALSKTADTQLDSLGIGVAPTGTSGEIVATYQITSYYSDDRLKDRIGNIENALDKVLSLNGFYYKANKVAQNLGYTDELQIGLSAQEVNNVLPEIIAPAPIDNQYMTIHYERVVPLLVEAIKEQQKQIEELKAKLGS